MGLGLVTIPVCLQQSRAECNQINLMHCGQNRNGESLVNLPEMFIKVQAGVGF